MGRVLAGYMGLNDWIIALAQTVGTTAQYGFVLHTGGMVLNAVAESRRVLVAWCWAAPAERPTSP
jgi:hypothetical protein